MASSQKKAVVPWTLEEIEMFLTLLGDDRVQSALDGARRNEPVYRELSAKMAQRGFQRTWLQCREKQKKMKCEYNREKASLSTSEPGRKVSRWFPRMDAIYGHRPPGFGREADFIRSMREAGSDTVSGLQQPTLHEDTDSGAATDITSLSRSDDNNTPLSSRSPSPLPGTSTVGAVVEPSPSPRPLPAESNEPAREPARRSLSLSQLSGKRRRTREPPALAAVLQQIHEHNKENDRIHREQRERKLQLLQAQADREAALAASASEQVALERTRAAQMDDRFLAVFQAIANALSPTPATLKT